MQQKQQPFAFVAMAAILVLGIASIAETARPRQVYLDQIMMESQGPSEVIVPAPALNQEMQALRERFMKARSRFGQRQTTASEVVETTETDAPEQDETVERVTVENISDSSSTTTTLSLDNEEIPKVEEIETAKEPVETIETSPAPVDEEPSVAIAEAQTDTKTEGDQQPEEVAESRADSDKLEAEPEEEEAEDEDEEEGEDDTERSDDATEGEEGEEEGEETEAEERVDVVEGEAEKDVTSRIDGEDTTEVGSAADGSMESEARAFQRRLLDLMVSEAKEVLMAAMPDRSAIETFRFMPLFKPKYKSSKQSYDRPEETPSSFQGFQENSEPPRFPEFQSDDVDAAPFPVAPLQEDADDSPVDVDTAQTTDFPTFNSEEPTADAEAPQEGRFAEDIGFKRPSSSRRRPVNNQRIRPGQKDNTQVSDDPFFSRVNSDDTYGPFEFKKIFGDVAWPKEDEPSGFSSDFAGRPNRPQNRQQSRARTGAAASNAETSVIRPYSDRTALPSSGQSNLNRRLQSRRNNYGERRNSASVDAEQEDVQKPEAKSTDSAVENPDLSNHSSSVDAPSQRRPSFRRTSPANKPKPVESSEPAASKSNDEKSSSNKSTAAISLSERRAAARERMLNNRRIQQKRISSTE